MKKIIVLAAIIVVLCVAGLLNTTCGSGRSTPLGGAVVEK